MWNFLIFFSPVIFVIGAGIWIEKGEIKKKNKRIFIHSEKAVQTKEPDKWEFPEDPFVKIRIRHQLVENLEFHVNIQKIALGLKLRLGSFSSYQEYCAEFDKLMEWKKEEWRKIYEEKF